MPSNNRNPFGKPFAYSEKKVRGKKSRPQRLRSEQVGCFSTALGTSRTSNGSPDAWGALEEMLYEQDCRFSSGQ